MAIKFFYVFILAFLIIVISMFIQEPYFEDWMPKDTRIANIKIINAQDYEITKNGVTGYGKTKEIRRFIDRDEFYGVELNLTRNGAKNFLKADKGILKNDKFHFFDNVKFIRDLNLTYISNELEYDMKNKILSSNIPFTAYNADIKVNGKRFIYDMSKESLFIEKINAFMKTRKK